MAGVYHAPGMGGGLPVWHDDRHSHMSRCPRPTTDREVGARSRMVRGLLCFPVMHLALRRFAEPPRGLAPLFGLGVLVGVLGLAFVAHRIERFERQEAHAAAHRDHHRKVAKAREAVRRYAFEAFPSWVVSNPELACPAARADLDVFLPPGAAIDPWGRPYEIECAPGDRLYAWSIGLDGVAHTADDVSSR